MSAGEWVGGGGGKSPRRGPWGPEGDRRRMENQRWEGRETQRGRSERGHPPVGLTAGTTAGGGLAGGQGWGGRGPMCRFRGPTHCAASRASMAVLGWFTAGRSRHPYLYLGPAPWGQGCLSSALLENPLREGVRGGGWIAQPLGHVVGRAGPGAGWIWGSPQLGAGVTLRGGNERSWIWGALKGVLGQ